MSKSIIVNGIELVPCEHDASQYVRTVAAFGQTVGLSVRAMPSHTGTGVSLAAYAKGVSLQATAFDIDPDLAFLGALEALINVTSSEIATKVVMEIVALQIADGEIAMVAQ